MEGTHPYEGGENPHGRRAPDLRVRPRRRAARSSAATCTAGDDIPGLAGAYLFGDYCATGVRGLQVDGDTRGRHPHLGPRRSATLYSFGQDDDGELYVLMANGAVLKLVAP